MAKHKTAAQRWALSEVKALKECPPGCERLKFQGQVRLTAQGVSQYRESAILGPYSLRKRRRELARMGWVNLDGSEPA